MSRALDQEITQLEAECEHLTRLKSLRDEIDGLKADLGVVGRKSDVEAARAIINIVRAYYGLGMREMISSRRPEYITKPRQVAMYLIRKLTALSLASIADLFMKKDHGTVLHACRAVPNMIDTEPDSAATIGLLEARCRTALLL